MQSIIHIRQSTSADSPAIDSLVQRAVVEQAKYRGRTNSDAIGDQCLVAEIGQSIVGILQYSVNDASAHIAVVHVHSDAREIGVADALVGELLATLAHQGVTWVSSHAQPGDRSLKNLFERHGLVAQQIVVGKSLSDPSTEEHASQ